MKKAVEQQAAVASVDAGDAGGALGVGRKVGQRRQGAGKVDIDADDRVQKQE